MESKRNSKHSIFILFLIFFMISSLSGKEKRISFIPEKSVHEFTIDFPMKKHPYPLQKPNMSESEIKELIDNLWIIDNLGNFSFEGVSHVHPSRTYLQQNHIELI